MKIVLNSVDDVEDFLKMLSPAYLRLAQTASEGMDRLSDSMDRVAEKMLEKVIEDNQETWSAQAESASARSASINYEYQAVSESSLADEPGRSPAEAGLPGKDADGAPHNTDWHSDPAKINADGTWRARRKRDEAAYKDWLLSLAVEVAEKAIADDAEPVATETHALPQDEVQEAGSGVTEPLPASEPEATPTVDHAALIEASQEAAKDAPDGTIDLLNAGKEFISEYGTAKFEALKAAVCPTEDGKGKSIPSMDPAERRLMRACMDNYALYL